MTPQPIVDIPGLAQPSDQLYPLADHVADKLTATRLTYGTDHLPSSRVRDLVDLAFIARTRHLDSAALSTAITAKRLLHELAGTDTFTTPENWRAVFGKAAAGTELGDHATYPQDLGSHDGQLLLALVWAPPAPCEPRTGPRRAWPKWSCTARNHDYPQ